MFDNVSKFLIEQYSPDFASWLIGEPIALTELSPSELLSGLVLDKQVIR
jgi:predicted transposase YdaD